ncbi:MAG: chloride channel protein [Acidobacteriota bacterium]
MTDTQRFLLLSILIGAFAGLLVTAFHIAIELVSWSALGLPTGARRWSTVLSPCLGAGLAGLFVRWVAPSARGSGIIYTKSAIYVSDGYIPATSIAGKFTACVASIGSGAPLGPEDPALQMGAGVASVLGRVFTLARDDMRHIAPVGAAAGIAAAFNTPITAVLFVIEEVLSGWSAGVFGSIVLSAASASVVSRAFLGDDPLFTVPDMALRAPAELVIAAGIGLVAGVLSRVYAGSLLSLKERAKSWPAGVAPALPFVAGLLTGLVALVLPGVLGAGYRGIDAALHSEFPWLTLIALALAKTALTAVSFGSGVPGGLFAPTLFVGAMLGGGLGGLAAFYWPLAPGAMSAYVLIGMGAFFAAVFRTPMTSIFMVFEVSATYVIILPVMIANTVAYLVSRALMRHSLFESLGTEEGVRFPSVQEMRARRAPRVEDIMQPLDGRDVSGLDEVHPDEPIDAALLKLRAAQALAVVSRGAPPVVLGIISRDDVRKWLWPDPAEHRPAGTPGSAEEPG